MMITMHCQEPQPTHHHHVWMGHHHLVPVWQVPLHQVWPTQYQHAPLQTPTQNQQVPRNQALVKEGSKRLEIVAPGPKGEAPEVKRGTSTGSPTDEPAAQVDRQCVSDLCVMHVV